MSQPPYAHHARPATTARTRPAHSPPASRLVLADFAGRRGEIDDDEGRWATEYAEVLGTSRSCDGSCCRCCCPRCGCSGCWRSCGWPGAGALLDGYHDPLRRRVAIVQPEVARELALRAKAKTALAAHCGIPAQAPPGRPSKELIQKRHALPVYVNAYCAAALAKEPGTELSPVQWFESEGPGSVRMSFTPRSPARRRLPLTTRPPSTLPTARDCRGAACV